METAFSLIIAGVGAVAGVFSVYMVYRASKRAEKTTVSEVQLELQKTILADAQAEVLKGYASRDELQEVKSTVRDLSEKLDDAVGYIRELEILVPTPPGLPPRPHWMRSHVA